MTRRLHTISIAAIAAMGLRLGGPEPLMAADSDLGTFTDDNGHPGEPYIEWLAEREIVHGCNPPANTRFCPDQPLNRAEAASIVADAGLRAGGFPSIPLTLPDRFVDDDEIRVGAASRLANYLARWASGVGRFAGDAIVTRAEFARAVVLAMGEDLCPPGPFTEERVGSLDRRFPKQSFTPMRMTPGAAVPTG